jgi:hypothetical protein
LTTESLALLDRVGASSSLLPLELSLPHAPSPSTAVAINATAALLRVLRILDYLSFSTVLEDPGKVASR